MAVRGNGAPDGMEDKARGRDGLGRRVIVIEELREGV